MKRRWPKGIVYFEKGLTPAGQPISKETIHKIVRREKRRTHKRERREGKRDIE